MSLHRHVVQVASYLRDGCSPAFALEQLGIDDRYSPTYRRQVVDEGRDWIVQMRQLGRTEWMTAGPCPTSPTHQEG